MRTLPIALAVVALAGCQLVNPHPYGRFPEGFVPDNEPWPPAKKAERKADDIRTIPDKDGRDEFLRKSAGFPWWPQALIYAAETNCTEAPAKQRPKCSAAETKRLQDMMADKTRIDAEQTRVQNDNAAKEAEHYRLDAQAENVCAYKQRITQASYPDHSLLGLEALVAGAGAKNACLDLYRQTGIIPQP